MQGCCGFVICVWLANGFFFNIFGWIRFDFFRFYLGLVRFSLLCFRCFKLKLNRIKFFFEIFKSVFFFMVWFFPLIFFVFFFVCYTCFPHPYIQRTKFSFSLFFMTCKLIKFSLLQILLPLASAWWQSSLHCHLGPANRGHPLWL